MYVLKTLKGINAVQTLSRLNRICPPYDKKTFILDFANKYEDIQEAFSKYYTTTILTNSVCPNDIYDLSLKIDSNYIFDPVDIDHLNVLILKDKKLAKDKGIMNSYFQRAVHKVKEYEGNKQKEILSELRHFVRLYEFLSAATSFEDIGLHKKYVFISLFLSYIELDDGGAGFNLEGKLKASGFIQKKSGEHLKSKINPNPFVKLPSADDITLTEAKEEKLSEIIREINERTGKNFDTDVAKRAAIQVRDMMKKDENLRKNARNNSEKDFSFAYYDHIDDALIDGMEKNKEFFTLLLNDNYIKRQVLGIFAEEIYNSLRN